MRERKYLNEGQQVARKDQGIQRTAGASGSPVRCKRHDFIAARPVKPNRCPQCGKRDWDKLTAHKSKCKSCGYVQREMV
jgi:predicted Zn-ribbon and HTH transcriptional regulator